MERFWSRTTVSADGCLEWNGALSPTGYGRFQHGGKNGYAHRVAWKLATGRDPGEACVLHRCDNRRCVNPAHLFLGTKGENNADRDAKGRTARPKGERNTQARLSASDVREIRRRASVGESQRAIAHAFNISQQHVSDLARGSRWGHLAEVA